VTWGSVLNLECKATAGPVQAKMIDEPVELQNFAQYRRQVRGRELMIVF